MTRAEFYAKQETAWRRHEKQRQEFASWYAYLCYKILRNRGYDHTPALEATFRRHPRAFEHFYGRLCEPTASTNSPASAGERLKPASETSRVRTAAAASVSTGGLNAD